jgi:hypothetical protein
MKNIRVILMAAAILLAVTAAFATKVSKKFFVTAYVQAASTSCQMTSAPAVCNTTGSAICTVISGGNPTTFYQGISGNQCVNAFKKAP